MKAKPYTVLLVLLLILSNSVHSNEIEIYPAQKQGQILVVNAVPYHSLVTIIAKTDRKEVYQFGPILLKPGEEYQFNQSFKGSKPEFFLYHHSSYSDTELVKWYFDINYNDSGIFCPDPSEYDDETVRYAVSRTAKSGEKYLGEELAYGPDFKKSKERINPRLLRPESNLQYFQKLNLIGDRRLKSAVYVIKNELFERKEGLLNKPYTTVSNVAKSRYALLKSTFNKAGRITITNAVPYYTLTSIQYMASKDSSVVLGWLELAPGESKSFNVEFHGSKPMFHVFTQTTTRDTDILKWKYELEETSSGIMSFNGDFPFPTFESPDKMGRIDKIIGSNNSNSTSGIRTREQPFRRLEAKLKDDVYETEHTIRDGSFPQIYRSKDERLAAKNLYASLKKEYKRTAKFNLRNLTPFTLYAYLDVQYSRHKHKTKGYIYLPPGSEEEFEADFYGIDPKFSVYAHTSSPYQVASAYNVSITEDPTIYFQPPKEETALYRSVKEREYFEFETGINESKTGSGIETVAFTTIEAKRSGSGNYYAEYEFKDDNFEFISNQSSIEAQKYAAKALNSAITHKRVYEVYASRGFIKSFPYLSGFNFYDPNHEFQPYLVVDEVVFEKNILGLDVQLKPGDTITHVNGELIFGFEDLHGRIFNHAQSLDAGIQVPMTYRVIRNGNIFDVQSLYYFNPDSDFWPSNEETKAFFMAVGGALSLGFDVHLYQLISPKNGWKYAQEKARMRQFYEGIYAVGDLGGTILSPGGLLFKGAVRRQLVRIGLGKTVSGIGSSILLETGESILFTVAEKHPIMTQGEFRKEMTRNVKYGAVSGFVSGSFFKLIKK